MQSGDMVLVHGTWEQFHSLQESSAEASSSSSPFEKEFHKPEKAKWASDHGFATALLSDGHIEFLFSETALIIPCPLSVCLMVGALGMIREQGDDYCNEAYRAVDWRTVFPAGRAYSRWGWLWIRPGTVQPGSRKALSSVLGRVHVAHCCSWWFSACLILLSLAWLFRMSGPAPCSFPWGFPWQHQIGIDPQGGCRYRGGDRGFQFLHPAHPSGKRFVHGPGGIPHQGLYQDRRTLKHHLYRHSGDHDLLFLSVTKSGVYSVNRLKTGLLKASRFFMGVFPILPGASVFPCNFSVLWKNRATFTEHSTEGVFL